MTPEHGLKYPLSNHDGQVFDLSRGEVVRLEIRDVQLVRVNITEAEEGALFAAIDTDEISVVCIAIILDGSQDCGWFTPLIIHTIHQARGQRGR